MNYYNVLGITSNATEEEIKSAYRKKAKEYHPDRCPGNAEALRKFKEVQLAYDTLINMPRPKSKESTPKRTVRKDFAIYDAPPPKMDLWGKPLDRYEQAEWARNNSGDVVQSKNNRKTSGFIDIWRYEEQGVPDIR